MGTFFPKSFGSRITYPFGSKSPMILFVWETWADVGGVRQRWTNLIQSDFLCCVRVKKLIIILRRREAQEDKTCWKINRIPIVTVYLTIKNSRCVCECVFGVGSCEGKDSWEMGKERWGFKKRNRKGKAVNHLLCLRRHIEILIRSHNTDLHKSWETF